MISKSNVALQPELDALNAEVTAVLAKRKAWMDAHMADFSEFKVGDEVYDQQTGNFLGTVTELYRYWDSQRNPLYDTSMSVEIRFRTPSGGIDNSSRHAGAGPWFCTREDAIAAAKSRAEYLAWKARGSDWTEVFK